jgi:hypothetical protein
MGASKQREGKSPRPAFQYLRKGKRPPTPPVSVVPPIVYDERMPNLTQSELQSTYGILADQQARIDTLEAEVALLEAKLQHEDQACREASSFLNGEISLKDGRARSLELDLAAKTKQADRSALALKKDLQRQLKEQNKEFDQVEETLRQQITRLQGDNQQLISFRQQQRKMEQQIKELHQSNKEMRDLVSWQEQDCARKLVAVDTEALAAYEAKLEVAKQDAKKVARKELSVEVRIQQAQRERYREEVEAHVSWEEEYFAARTAVKQQSAQLRQKKQRLQNEVQARLGENRVLRGHNQQLVQSCGAMQREIGHILQELEHLKQPKRSVPTPVPVQKRTESPIAFAELEEAVAELQIFRNGAEAQVEVILGETLREAAQQAQLQNTDDEALLNAVGHCTRQQAWKFVNQLTWPDRVAILEKVFDKIQNNQR